MLCFLKKLTLFVLFFWTSLSHIVFAHEGHTEASTCDNSDVPFKIIAPYVPGTITIDGNSSDWDSVDGQFFKMRQAFGTPTVYPQGSGEMLIKVAHDGRNIYVLLQTPGAFVWSSENAHLAPSVALMFGIGDDASFNMMGGCAECSEEACRGHEVDLLHFELSTAIPGRLYGTNVVDKMLASGKDSIGSLNDMFAWNPHCLSFDSPPASSGINASNYLFAGSGAQNEWQGSWSHTSISLEYGLVSSDAPFGKMGTEGDYVFEFTRPLRTEDRFQQDVQLTIGNKHRFGAAIWYPVGGEQWSSGQHYVLSCDWVSLDLFGAPRPYSGWESTVEADGLSNSWAAAIAALALLISLSAIFIVMVISWWVRAHGSRSFTPLDGL